MKELFNTNLLVILLYLVGLNNNYLLSIRGEKILAELSTEDLAVDEKVANLTTTVVSEPKNVPGNAESNIAYQPHDHSTMTHASQKSHSAVNPISDFEKHEKSNQSSNEFENISSVHETTTQAQIKDEMHMFKVNSEDVAQDGQPSESSKDTIQEEVFKSDLYGLENEETLLDAFGKLAQDFLTHHMIPQTDIECRWDWRYLRCEPFCQCSLQSQLGDYHLGRSCRLRESELNNMTTSCEQPPDTFYTDFFESTHNNIRHVKENLQAKRQRLQSKLMRAKLVAAFMACDSHDDSEPDVKTDKPFLGLVPTSGIKRALCRALTPEFEHPLEDEELPELSISEENLSTIGESILRPQPRDIGKQLNWDGMGLPDEKTPADLMAAISRKRKNLIGK